MSEKNEKEKLFADDPYWDIDTLMPKKTKTVRAPQKQTPERVSPQTPASPAPTLRKPAVPTTEKLFVAPYEYAEDAHERKSGFPLHPFAAEPDRRFVYEHGERGAVKQVETYAWPNKYAFFAGFRRNAQAIFDMKGTEAPYVEYFSFMPQYHQLTAAQLRYYLWWRDCFHAGKYLRADFCYLLLYICEVINLSDLIDPQVGVERLCRLWLYYRRSYAKLDKYLSEWVCDYCLVNGVYPSPELFAQIAPYGRQQCVFKEFYLTKEELARPGLLSSSYAYKSSKYRTPENAEVFDTHIPAAMDRFFEVYAQKDKRFEALSGEEAKISRMSYDGAVCVYSEKKRIDVVYTPVRILSPSMFVTDAVKLCENYVRSSLGIRARFPTPCLDAPMREAIEEYFVRRLPSPSTRKSEIEYKYDDRYEPGSRGFSAEEAARIEESSRAVANELGKVWAEDEQEICKAGVSEEAGFEIQHREALRALRDGGNAAFAAYAASKGVLPHTLAEELNEAAIGRIGDIVIVGDEGGFELLPDYRAEVDEWMDENN